MKFTEINLVKVILYQYTKSKSFLTCLLINAAIICFACSLLVMH